MPTLHQFDYLFAIGVIFCTLDAFMIGANDVANSFATSVSSKSLSMKQAILAAAIFEFLGAVTVGARTASTIKNGESSRFMVRCTFTLIIGGKSSGLLIIFFFCLFFFRSRLVLVFRYCPCLHLRG